MMATKTHHAITQVSRQYRVSVPEPITRSASLVSVSTLVLWLFCVCVGAAGLLFPYPRPAPRLPEPAPVVADVLNVQLSQEPSLPLLPKVVAPDPAKPPPLHQIVVPSVPPMVTVAEPSPAVAFPLPVHQPSRVVPAAQASPVLRDEPPVSAAVPPPLQVISYGEGEGRQPAPEYPRAAVREGQEGVVRIRFNVAENGRVLNAEVASPSPWPLLNDAALRVVRGRWRFREGPPRLFEVAIRFELTK